MARFQRLHSWWRSTRWSTLLAAPLRTGWAFIVFGVAAFLLNYHFTHYPRPDFWRHVWVMLLDLYVLAALTHFLPRCWRFGVKGVWYVLMYALGFVESFLYKRFYIIYDAMALMLGAETDGGEASEFLQGCLSSRQFWPTLWPWLLLVAIHLLTFCLSLWLRKRRVGEKPLLRKTGVVCGMLCSLVIACYIVWQGPTWLRERHELATIVTGSTTGYVESHAGPVVYSHGLRLVAAAKLYHLSIVETERLADKMAQAQVDSCDYLCPRIVLLVGESYNKHHSAAYGYPVPTTPYQSHFVERGAMVAFSDVVSPWNLTSNVFKNMLSTHSVDQPGSWTDGVLFPALFRQAGYRVRFLTNQFTKRARQDRADFSGSFFLNDERFDSLCFDIRNANRYNYDTNLFSELPDDARLPRDVKGELLIFHVRGQHMVYAKRCPASRVRFYKEDYDRPDLTDEERQIVADYDNATLYNDEVVARLCGYFKHEDAIVVCMADHGDEVFDGTIGMYGRNHTMDLTPAVARGEFEVPFQIWASRKFRARHRTLWKQIQEAADRPFMTDDLPHLLLGLAGIHCQQYDASRNLISPDYNPNRPRLLKEKYDYDKLVGNKK